jgi:hypothetical protein
MRHRIPTAGTASLFALTVALLWFSVPSVVQAQRGQRGAPTAKTSAPIDLTGYWTAVITEDWHVRMLTAPTGDFGTGAAGAIEMPGTTHSANGPIGVGPNPSFEGNIPYKPKGAQAAMQWNAAKDEAEGNQCKAYGAPGIMRQPTHLHITWQDDNTLKMDIDYGTQTRLFHFPAPAQGPRNLSSGTYIPGETLKTDAPAGTQPSWQGYSVASWNAMGGRGSFERGGSLKVVTSRLKPGYYWKNGMPYTGEAVLTEYFRLLELPDNSAWLILSEAVEDPEYLTQPFVLNYHFRKLPDGSKWNPTPCTVK